MLPALAEAIEHPDMTEELAEVLSTPTVDLSYRIETSLTVNPSQQTQADEWSTGARESGFCILHRKDTSQ